MFLVKNDDFGVLLDHGEDFALTHNDKFLTIDIDGEELIIMGESEIFAVVE